MDLKVTPEWLNRKLKEVDDSTVGAGCMTQEEFARDAASRRVTPSAVESAQNELGKVVRYVREQNGWSQERLAEIADVELREIVGLETEMGYVPRSRTAYSLANSLGFSHNKMKELLGLLESNRGAANDRNVYLAFAAHSKHVTMISDGDYDVIRALVDVLADKSDDNE
ncbi:MAG TPA: helix-turn-helix transcriptional regulator [Gammaproteobacteria bacterium]|jgi:DNA-binding XRE family transcriptional regulator|nr:helix-turn-helix transcriptional regulator [Gammaproteobacteria bacterium]